MGFREICRQIERSSKYGFPAGASDRYKRLDAYDRLLEATFYDHITKPFEKESTGSNYISISERRPSIIYPLAKNIVEQHASLTFGEAHFPMIRCRVDGVTSQSDTHNKTELACAALVKAMSLPAIMQAAVIRGSIGSAVLIAKVDDDGAPSIDVVSGKNAKPVLNRKTPDKMEKLERIWPVTGETLEDFGYEIEEGTQQDTYWLRVTIDSSDWTWYKPMTDQDYAQLGVVKKKLRTPVSQPITRPPPKWMKDDELSGSHGFPVNPAVWLRNLAVGDDSIDGPCTFAPIADICVQLDYLLSQTQRGVKYSMDPLMVLKTGEMGKAALGLADRDIEGNITKSAANAMALFGPDADAKLLEMTGRGFEVGGELIKRLREYALEVSGGMRSDVDKTAGNQSGRALELLFQNVVWFVERVRISYGDRGLVRLLRVLLAGLKDGTIDLGDGQDWSDVDPLAPLSLIWPKWWLPRGSDLMNELSALGFVAGSGQKAPQILVDPNTMSKYIAQTLDLDDPVQVAADAEAARNEEEKKRDDQMQAELDAKTAGPTGGGQ